MTDPNTDPSVEPRDAPPRGGKAKAIPPLAWIILALLLVIVLVALSQCDALRTTPGGDQIPQTNLEEPAEAVMPATPPPATNPVVSDEATTNELASEPSP